jgi:type IV secretory pathway VirD2 relaxase
MEQPRIAREEIEIRTRLGRGRRHKATPWWLLLGKRVGRLRRASTRRGNVRKLPERSGRRRSIVKASYSRNDGSKSWTAHARYLTREGAQRHQVRGIGFDSVTERLDMVATVRSWEKSKDQLMWRLIVSPEDAQRLDLTAHARGLVSAMERDLGTQLEWVGIEHHDTDNRHVHILIRGRDDNGRRLEIDRDYIRSGIRARSREIVERELGLRPEREMLAARDRVIGNAQWTEVDWAIKRRAGLHRVISYYGDWSVFREREQAERTQELRRVKILEMWGLATRHGEQTWELHPDWENELRRTQREKDVQKLRGVGRVRAREVERG